MTKKEEAVQARKTARIAQVKKDGCKVEVLSESKTKILNPVTKEYWLLSVMVKVDGRTQEWLL